MSNTLKFGNGQWATKEGSTLAYNDENNNFKPLPFNFERASSATVINKDGLIETVGSGQPRIDYKDDSNGALLLEPSRTNLITYSEDFSNGNWAKYGTTVTSGFTSPDGSLNAFKLVEDTNNSKHFISRNNLFTPDGVTRDYSIFVKEGEKRYIFITNVTTTNNDINCAVFDTRDGVFTNTNNPTYISNRNVTTLSNGWYRIDFTSNVNSFSYDNFYIGISSSETMSGVSYQGDGTSGVYIYGAQLEEGSYPTSYIPTQGSAVTRLAEISVTQTPPSGIINSSEGVFYAEMSALSNDGASRYISLSNGSTSNRVVLRFNSSNEISGFVFSGTTQASFSYDVNILNKNKVALKWKQNDFALWVNGFEVGTDTSGVPPINLSLLRFEDGADNGQYFYGNVKEIKLYNTALTDAELIALTS